MASAKGGKREGAGRPAAPPRPAPVSWRPDTQAQRDAWLELGGPKWVRRLLDEYIAAKKNDRLVALAAGVGEWADAED